MAKYSVRDEEMDELAGSIKSLIKGTESFIKKQVPLLHREVEYIINHKITSSQNIESLLDTLLGTSSMGCGKKEFKKLNDYYSKISPEAAADYARFYKEQMETEE